MDEKARRERMMYIIREFRLMDDDFMSVVLDGQNELVGFILGIILERNDLTVISAKTQVEYKNTTKRSLKLDVKAIDDKGKIYNIEIQRSDRGAGVKRARMHSSTLDRELLDKGQDFDEMVETYVIFITEKDKFGLALPMYHIERTILEAQNALFGDGAHIIFVNGEYRNVNDPVGRLMHDFHCKSAGEMFYEPIAEQVKYYKEEEGGNKPMCRLMEEFGKDERQDERVVIAKEMIANNAMPLDQIAKYFGLTLDEVKKLAEKKKS